MEGLKCKVQGSKVQVHGSKYSVVVYIYILYLYVALFIDEYVARLPGEQGGRED